MRASVSGIACATEAGKFTRISAAALINISKYGEKLYERVFSYYPTLMVFNKAVRGIKKENTEQINFLVR